MRVYVSSNYTNELQVKRLMKFLTDTGHEIIYDWTHKNNNLSREIDGINSIKTSDVLIALIDNQYNTLNNITFMEIGYAIGCGKIVLMHNTEPQNTSYNHRIQTFENLTNLIHFMKNATTTGIF